MYVYSVPLAWRVKVIKKSIISPSFNIIILLSETDMETAVLYSKIYVELLDDEHSLCTIII